MGTLSGIAAGALTLAVLDLALGAGSNQLAGLAAAPANWLAKFVDPGTVLIPDMRIPNGQVGKAGQLLQQIIPQTLAQNGIPYSPSASLIPAPNTIPPPTPPATLNA